MTKTSCTSIISCPHCGFSKEEEMPADSCCYFYECEQYKSLLKPQPQDCCVFAAMDWLSALRCSAGRHVAATNRSKSFNIIKEQVQSLLLIPGKIKIKLVHQVV